MTTQLTHEDLLTMSQPELDDLYRSISTPGRTPTGDTQGTALVFPGTSPGRVGRVLGRLLAWQGKVFNPEAGDLKNKITPLGFRSIRARVYGGGSWMDGGDAIIIDYSQTSIVAKWVRDEIREVAPGVWLGKVFIGKWHALDFTLTD